MSTPDFIFSDSSPTPITPTPKEKKEEKMLVADPSH
jgi:hypothetical protein